MKDKTIIMILFTILLVFVSSLHIVGATSANSFNNSLTTETFDLNKNSSQIRYLSFPEDVYLVNASMRFNTSETASAVYDTITGVSYTNGGSQTVEAGMKFEALFNATLKTVTQHSSNTCTTAYLYDSANPNSGSLLQQATFVGSNATFDYDLVASTQYYIVCDSGGSTYTLFEDTSVSYPITETRVEWKGGWLNGDRATQAQAITAVLTSNASVTVKINNSTEIATDTNEFISFSDYLSSCTAVSGNCSVPIYFTSDSDTNVTLTYSTLNYTNDGYIEYNRTFNTPVVSGSNQQFTITVSYDHLSYTPNVYLVHNGTDYLTSRTGTAPYYTYTRNITIPFISTSQIVNVSWRLEGLDATYNTTNSTQTINAVSIDHCSANTVLLMNLTLVDEETQVKVTPSSNTSIQVDLDLFPVNDATVSANFSHEYNGTWFAEVCLNESIINSTYNMDAQITYFHDNYVTEQYNIRDFEVTNTSIPQNITLFDLKSADSTEFLITFKDSNFLKVPDALIQIQRKYVGDGVFRTVEIPITDNQGQAVGHFDTAKGIYTIIVTKANQVLATFNNVVVVCQDEIIGDCDLNLNALSETQGFSNYETIGNLTYTTSFNRDTRTIQVVFTSTDGSAKNVTLITHKFDRFENITACSDSLTTSSGTLTCVIPTSIGNTTVISRLYSNGALINTELYTLNDDITDLLGPTAFFYVLVFLLVIPMMFAGSLVGIIFSVMIGFVFLIALQFMDPGNLFGATSSLLWLVVTGGILIWRLVKRE